MTYITPQAGDPAINANKPEQRENLQAHAASAGRVGAISPAPILAAQQGLAGSLQKG